MLGAIRRDRRYPHGRRLGRVRGIVLPGRNRAVVCSRLASVAPTRQRIGKSPIMVLVGDCRSRRSWQLCVLFREHRGGQRRGCGDADVLRTGVRLSRVVRTQARKTHPA